MHVDCVPSSIQLMSVSVVDRFLSHGRDVTKGHD
jgi:hypothetical protein